MHKKSCRSCSFGHEINSWGNCLAGVYQLRHEFVNTCAVYRYEPGSDADVDESDATKSKRVKKEL